MALKDKGVNWIHVAHNRDEWCALVDAAIKWVP